MDKPIENYWKIRLENLKTALEANNFEVFVADSESDAKKIFLDDILPKTGAASVAWGGSMTFTGTGLYKELKDRSDLSVIDTYDQSVSDEEKMERRRQALTVDLFITGTNAITESGQLVNLDMVGNRVAALVFGPKQVVVFVGRNKLVADLEEAMFRVKNHVAPINSMRLDMATPCVKTSYCEECKSPKRICNAWTISEKAFPKGRVKIVLINQDIGI